MDNRLVGAHHALGLQQIDVGCEVEQDFDLLFGHVIGCGTPEIVVLADILFAYGWPEDVALLPVRGCFYFSEEAGADKGNKYDFYASNRENNLI